MQPDHKHGHLESQHIEVQSLFHTVDGFQTPEAQFTCQTTEPWSRYQLTEPQTSYSNPEPRTSLQCLSVSATQLLSLKHVLRPEEQPTIPSESSENLRLATPVLGGMLQRLKILEDKTTQVNAATVQMVDSAHFPTSFMAL